MELHQLRIFHSAVKAGGFTHASRELHLSQSTVSQHIKQLEEEIGCQLFLRVGKRVLLTEAGQQVRLMRVKNHPLYRRLGLVTLKSGYIPNAVRELSTLIAEKLGAKSEGKQKTKVRTSTPPG